MHFSRVIAFILLLIFSFNTFAATKGQSALQVSKDVTFSGTPSYDDSSSYDEDGLTTGEAAGRAAGFGIGAGALAAAGVLMLTPVGWVAAAVGGAAAAITALTTYILSRPNKSSFVTIMNAFQSLAQGSWLSPVFNMLFNTINQLAVSVNNYLGDTVVKILAIMMAFYILFIAIKHIVSFTPIEPSKFFGELFFPLGRMIIAVWAIKNWNIIFRDLLSPILNLAINFGTEILSSMNGSSASYSGSVGSGSVQTVYGRCNVTTPGVGLDRTVCDSIQTFLGTISFSLLVWMAFGATLLTDCWGQGWGNILPSFKMLSVGAIIFVFTFMLYLSFPLKLIDSMFRLMFIVVLFPLWCLFWVIPQTRQYFKKMIEMLINVAATFLSASVILVMVIAILGNLFSGIPLNRIIELLQEGKAEQAMDEIGFSTSGLFYSICLLFMAFHLVSKIEYFANLFSKMESLGIGEAMGKQTNATVAAGVPMAFRMGKNATKWGVGKVQNFANRARASNYNSNVPGGTARKAPHLFANPLTEAWDAHKAKDQIGTYSRTRGVQVSRLETARDGSTSQTYSNRTEDKQGNVLAQMRETTTSSEDKTKQSVDRQTAHFDEAGNVRKSANVKKDFEYGQAVRKTTTRTNKDGSRTETSVDKDGNVSKIRFSADGRKLSSERMKAQFDKATRKMKFGIRVLETYGADGSVTSTKRIGPDGKPIP